MVVKKCFEIIQEWHRCNPAWLWLHKSLKWDERVWQEALAFPYALMAVVTSLLQRVGAPVVVEGFLPCFRCLWVHRDCAGMSHHSHDVGMHRACATAAPITASLVIVLNKDASVSRSLRAEEWNQRVLGNSSLSDKLGLMLELVQFGRGALWTKLGWLHAGIFEWWILGRLVQM